MHVAEVLEKRDDGYLKVWYLWDGSQAAGLAKGRKRYDPNRKLCEWHSEPEWFDPSDDRPVSKPTDEQKKTLEKRVSELEKDDYEIVVPAFDGGRTTTGMFLRSVTDKVDDWLRKQRISKKQLLARLSTPTAVDTQQNQITLVTQTGLVHASVNASGEVRLIGGHRGSGTDAEAPSKSLGSPEGRKLGASPGQDEHK